MIKGKFSLKNVGGCQGGRVNFVSERKVSMPRHWYFFFDLKKQNILDEPNKQYTDVSRDVTHHVTSGRFTALSRAHIM